MSNSASVTVDREGISDGDSNGRMPRSTVDTVNYAHSTIVK